MPFCFGVGFPALCIGIPRLIFAFSYFGVDSTTGFPTLGVSVKIVAYGVPGLLLA
jgi:hypothetical protein